MRAGWTDGDETPFGEDFLNFWSGAHLAAQGAVRTLYRIADFHAFEQTVVGHAIDLCHYSYPPILPMITVPLGLLPYPLAWLVWQAGGWAAFASALRRFAPDRRGLVALAWPAVFVNAIGGQIGCWLAAVVGWGLILLPTRPWLAGFLLSLLAVKPQLGWLVPFALMAGREWRALAGFCLGGIALGITSLLAFGMPVWLDYLHHAMILKHVILEHGDFVWARMLSIFVLVRHAGAAIAFAYAAQAMASLVALVIVVDHWRRRSRRRSLVLIVAMLAGSIYVSDYDCVMLAFPVAALWKTAEPRARVLLAIVTVMPLVAALLATLTHVAVGAFALWAMLFHLARRPAACDRDGSCAVRTPALALR